MKIFSQYAEIKWLIQHYLQGETFITYCYNSLLKIHYVMAC